MPNSTLRNPPYIDVFGSNLGRCVKWGLVAVGLTISMTQGKAEYVVNVVNVGHVLEVGAAGIPELRSRAALQIDGNVSPAPSRWGDASVADTGTRRLASLLN